MLPLTRPSIDHAEVAEDLRKILSSGILTQGPYVAAFETAVAEYVGVRYAFATSSCTTGMHLALAAAGIGAGDEVLVPDFTFPATGNVVVQTGATPVLVDCSPGSFLMDLSDATGKISSRTRAIMPVDTFGHAMDMPRVLELAKGHGLVVVEDAACAIGASYAGRSCGSWPDMGCFSFHPRKLVTTGEGGVVTTNDESLAEAIRLLRNHGGSPNGVGLEFVTNGFNYRLGEIGAALGLAQMRRIDAILEDRRRIAALYEEELTSLPQVSLPPRGEKERPNFQSFVVMVSEAVDRDALVSALRDREIETTLGTYAMHAHPAFSRFGYSPGDLPNSWKAQQHSLTLPVVPGMSRAQVEEVTHVLRATI